MTQTIIKNGFSKNWNFSLSPEFKALMGNIPKQTRKSTIKVITVKTVTPRYFYKMRSQTGFMILGYKSINGVKN